MSTPSLKTADVEQRLLEVWRDAGLRPVEFRFDNTNAAVTFRHRMYKIRLAMEKEKHPYVASARRAKASIEVVLKTGAAVPFSTKKHLPLAEIDHIKLIFRPGDGADTDALLEQAGYPAIDVPTLD